MLDASTASQAPHSPGSYVRELWLRRDFAIFMAVGNLRARNASTYLGLMWWVIDPILLGMVYFLVFGVILKTGRGDSSFIAYLLSGMFPFYYTRAALQGGANSITQNARMLVNLRFPRLIMPMAALIEGLVGFLASILIYLAIVGPIAGQLPGVQFAIFPAVLLIHTMFNLGLGAFFARIAVPFRDIGNVIPYFLRIWLYLSPIIWTLDLLDRAPAFAVRALRMNPMFHIISLYRSALQGSVIEPESVIIATVWGVAVFVIGVGMFVRAERTMVRYL
jgi:teichoic acid transport system permease protein